MTSNRDTIKALRQLTPWEIANTITLDEAARLTSANKLYRNLRTSTAWHEACHVVVAVKLGLAARYCKIPDVPSPGSTGVCASFTALPNHSAGAVSDLEIAIISLCGDVAVGVTGYAQPHPKWPTQDTGAETSDTVQARWYTRRFLRDLDTLTSDPDAAPYITQWVAAHPTDSRLPTQDELAAQWLNSCMSRAISLTAEYFHVIDMVATVLLVHATGRDVRLSDELISWIQRQTDMPSWAQWCVGRECAYPVPDWLRHDADQHLSPLQNIGRELDRLNEHIPQRPDMDLSGFDFS